MGVDLHVTIQIDGMYEDGEYSADVCQMDVGRYYHWCNLTPDLLAHRYMGAFTFAQLQRRKDSPIFDASVKHTDLYLVMRALARKYGKRHVTARWMAE